MNRLILMVFAVAALAACKPKTAGDSSAAAKNDTYQPKTMMEIAGRYEGILPCADCKGIRTELLINPDSAFNLRQVYMGRTTADSTFQSFGKVAPFDYFTRFMLKSRQDSTERWLQFDNEMTAHLVTADGADPAPAGNYLLSRLTKTMGNEATGKLVYKVAEPTMNKAFVYSRNPRGDVSIDKAWIDKCAEGERAIVAFYAYVFGTGCQGNVCQLTTAMGLGEAGSAEHLALINKSLKLDSLLAKTGFKTDRTFTLGNLFMNKNDDKLMFNYTATDAAGKSYSGLDTYVTGSAGLRMESHRESALNQAAPGTLPPGKVMSPEEIKKKQEEMKKRAEDSRKKAEEARKKKSS